MATKVPSYTFSGTSSAEVRDGYWYIYLKSTGTLRMTYAKQNVDVLAVGGGGKGGSGWYDCHYGAAGGGAGYHKEKSGQSLAAGTDYSITVGKGATGYSGDYGGTGGTTTAFGLSAAGGTGGKHGADDDGYAIRGHHQYSSSS